MDKVKKGLSNQAIGFIPLLLFMYLDNYFTNTLSFIIGITLCFTCIFLFHMFSKDKIYQFSLLPTAAVFIFYSLFVIFNIQPILTSYTPLLAEILLVVILAIVGFSRKSVLVWIRNSDMAISKKAAMRTGINEYYFICLIFQNLFTFHLFIILFYVHIGEAYQRSNLEHFLYREMPLLIGVFILLYEQIRIYMMRGNLKKEMWLPVLNEKGHVIGSMARSVSRTATKKYYHPIVRIAVLYKGMLYLVKRGKNEYISPEQIDYPFTRYVLFRQSIEATVREALGPLGNDNTVIPRFLIRYTFENEKVKHLVSLYVINLQNDEQLKYFHGGKLWTIRQIEDNLNANVFSEYFEKEFPYLQNTILLAEKVCMGEDVE